MIKNLKNKKITVGKYSKVKWKCTFGFSYLDFDELVKSTKWKKTAALLLIYSFFSNDSGNFFSLSI